MVNLWSWTFPEGRTRIHSLDVLRATAIIAVIFYHFPRSENQIIWRAFTHFGNLGVDLFFVLSGYLIGGQLFNKLNSSQNISIKNFYVKRFLRTLPSYYIALFLNILLVGTDFFDWRYLIFLQNFGGLYQFTHSWSLCIEEQFYLCLPLIIYFFNKNKIIHYYPAFILILFAVGFIWRSTYWYQTRPDLEYIKNVSQGYEIYFKYIFYPTIGRLDGIAFGTLMAFTKVFNPTLWCRLMNKTNFFLFAGLGLAVALVPFIYFKVGWFNVVFGFSLISIAFGSILISAASSDSLLRRIKIPGLTTISLLSYSLYLTHGWAIDLASGLCRKYLISTTSLAAYSMMFIFSIIFSLILYLTVERPFLVLRHKILSRVGE